MILRTPRDPVRVPGVLGATALAVGLVLLGVASYDVVRILALRRRRPRRSEPLVHDAVVGDGGEPLRLVVLGDSAAAGYGLDDADLAYPRQVAAQLSELRERPVELVSFAADGARLADLRRTQVPHLDPGADVIVAAAGVNDAIGRVPPPEVELDTAVLLAAIRDRAPHAEVVLVGCPDLSSAPGFPWPLHHLVGRWCQRTCAAQERAWRRRGRHDPRSRFVRYPGRPSVDMYGDDGFHPGPAGQAAAAAATVAALRGP